MDELWEKRVRELEAEGMTRSDAQAAADAEIMHEAALDMAYANGARAAMNMFYSADGYTTKQREFVDSTNRRTREAVEARSSVRKRRCRDEYAASATPIEFPLSCPFCGVDAGLYRSARNTSAYVYCNNENCEVRPETHYHEETEQAIAAWNTRPGSAQGGFPALIAALSAKREEVRSRKVTLGAAMLGTQIAEFNTWTEALIIAEQHYRTKG